MAANPIDIGHNSEPPAPPQPVVPESLEVHSSHFVLVSIIASFAAIYFAKIVFVVLFVSLLLAFVLEPLARTFERIRIPRAAGALLSVVLFMGAVSAVGLLSYNKALDFAQELPKYSGEIRGYFRKFERQAQTLKKTTQEVLPETTDKNTIKVKQESSVTDTFFSGLGTATEMFFAASFVPFLAYFMLTWKEHTRSNLVLLFRRENRSTVYALLGAITDMVRSFIVGNVLVGLFIGAISTGVFALMGLPYFYFIGFISGFLSLVPYLGVMLAVVPPLLSGMGHVHSSGFFIIIGTVVGLHLFALNVLYPKFLGKRLQLNPLAVTVALLFWGWIWGAMGLILAIPLTAAAKIICDHIVELRPLGGLLGESTTP